MKDWYLRQTPRDRMIVIAVAVLVFLGLLYALAWYPLQKRLVDTRQAIVSKTETLEYLQRGAAQLTASGGNASGGERRESDKAPYLLIDEILRKAGITQADRVEPSGANGARVQFSEVAFDRLVVVLAELELYGLEVSNMTITRKNQGTVSARFTMERG